MGTPFWYNALLALVKPLYRKRLYKRSGHLPDFQDELLERFGPFQPPLHTQALWFHAVSVGETNAAQPLIEHYLSLGQPVLLTNTTRTGQARAKSLFSQRYPKLFQAVFLPVDQRYLIEEFLSKYQPKLLALVETELWPNLLQITRFRHIPVLLLNARLSEKSAKGYARVKGLSRSMVECLDSMLAQDQPTRQRYIELGMPPEAVQVVGNIKFDISAPPKFTERAAQLKRDWQLEPRKIILLASTHAPEELELLTALRPFLQKQPELLCIVVPRHPERFNEVFEQCQKLALLTRRRSLDQTIQPDTQVYLADSMGELWLWYVLSQACFVGGSLNEPGGGHNILEPIALHVPTVIGIRYFNFQSIVDEFVEAQGILIAHDANEAVNQLLACIDDPEAAGHLSQQAYNVLQKNQGSLNRHIHAIDQYL
ncbi:3-deoxy-D-manno-octulosonic acid transferase [Acinetobacter radioresistens]|uniref:3-deoxy-D-manno-octulosonic acid transferase n=1 Tax=Acinetobacter radioresistens TaxID=40216 RepID=UPI000C331B42|nr:3-deoxy-D-manno-octulosonic acid transferase [Acinetobacter radioresistens]PKH30197.1 3-deoxy-D-manno-2-octulosonate transferase [Acinetobacter radioresistens]